MSETHCGVGAVASASGTWGVTGIVGTRFPPAWSLFPSLLLCSSAPARSLLGCGIFLFMLAKNYKFIFLLFARCS